MDEELLALLLGRGGTPIRRDIRLRVVLDPDGSPTLQPLGMESHILSADGSVDRVEVVRDQFYSCGHSTQFAIGGQCRECGQVSCAQCFSQCAACRTPLCRTHAEPVQTGQASGISLCRRCLDDVRRRAFWSRVTRGLIAPPSL
jgi:hypothetical protein